MAVQDGLVYEFREINGHKFEDDRLKFRIQWTTTEHSWEDVTHMGYVRDALVDYHRAYGDVMGAMLKKNGVSADITVQEVIGARFHLGTMQFLVKREGLSDAWENIEVLSGDDVIAAMVRFHDAYGMALTTFLDKDGHGPQEDDVVIVDYE